MSSRPVQKAMKKLKFAQRDLAEAEKVLAELGMVAVSLYIEKTPEAP